MQNDAESPRRNYGVWFDVGFD